MKKLTTIILCILLLTQLYTIYSVHSLRQDITDTRAEVARIDNTVKAYAAEVKEYKQYVTEWRYFWNDMFRKG